MTARILPTSMMCALAMLGATACTGTQADQADAAAENQSVSLRGLADTTAATETREEYKIHGKLIPTPSDTSARYFLLRERERLLADTIVAIIRQERTGRIAYARVELNCGKRLFHVLGVGNRRAFAETDITYDGPLRPIEGLPLRQELAAYICNVNGTPLAAA